MAARPQVGIAVLILDSKGRAIMGLRQGSHGAGTWALPGGHLEYSESFDACAKREVLEETGLTVGNVQFLAITNDFMPAEGKHYVTVFVGCVILGDKKEPEAMEPDKCARWEWMDWNEVSKWAKSQAEAEKSLWTGHYLFLPIVNLFRQHPDFDIASAYNSYS
ncbi:hypothetical protein K432DRAFT_302034 [Lepidopterella palustris CBS 459.81]|uniref:Nudix hydrolase domain-containing protein n=1 Tax=Lepidopterella palustris CBS 459.81 TaxID=1314670 RepID=A0A8E2JDB2_9PEZI|nr:hypothetical protein K432DRAFT_302034 [Lepidopterella palustris CBS 459.81]